MRKIMLVAAMLLAIAPANAEPSSVLRSLPSAVQKQIGEIRDNCPAEMKNKNTSEDDGRTFSVSGAQAVLIDQIEFCADGQECLHGVNCATGYTYQVEIYIRRGNGWRKSFSVFATSVIWLGVDFNDNDYDYPYFRALVISVHGGDDVLNCPVRNKNDPTAWKPERCDFVVKWDGTKFIHKPL